MFLIGVDVPTERRPIVNYALMAVVFAVMLWPVFDTMVS